MQRVKNPPFELAEHICSFLPPEELRGIATSCSLLCAAAQANLFRNIVIVKSSLELILTLACKPHLCRRVRQFKIVVEHSSDLPLSYCRALSIALSQMRGLQMLSISIPPYYRPSLILPCGPDLNYPTLRTIQASFSLDESVVDFLLKTPALTSLAVDDGGTAGFRHGCPNITLSCIPNLEVFTGPSDAAQIVVPGRPVGSIFLTSGDISPEVIASLAQSSSPVSTLSAITTSSPLPILRGLAAMLPQIHRLRLITTYSIWEEDFNEPVLHSLKGILFTISALESVEISGFRWRWTRTREGRVLINEPYPPLPPHHNDDDIRYSQWTDGVYTHYHH